MNDREMMFRSLHTARAILVISLVLTGPLLCAGTPGPQGDRAPFRIITYNIRYDNPGDGLNSWDHRKETVSSLILFHDADIACIQEGLVQQVRYLHGALKGFAYCGVGRDDGKEAGEYSAIFYRQKMLDRIADSTFWLSPTPSRPSKGWDAALPRIVTWAHFKIKATGRSFFVFNTHFDHMGEIARRESARLLLSQIPRIAGDHPAIVTGDFNSTDQDSAYQILVRPVKGGSLLKDSFFLSELPHYGVASTFFGFDACTQGPGERIDFVFVTAGITVLRHGTLTDFVNGRFSSDHLPVLIEVALTN
jgi:endonuclease/exonuclease/phosphatase family metal-dependent hydrolase